MKKPLMPLGFRARLLRLVLRFLLRLVFRIRIVGRANIPRTQLIICPNHLSWADGLLVLLFFPTKPKIHALARSDEVFKNGFRRWVVEAVRVVVPLEQGKPVQAMRTMRGILDGGGSLLIFPEGAVEGSQEGDLLPLQPGAIHLSVHSGVPILPVGMTGTKEMWLRRTLTVRIGKPIDPSTAGGEDRHAQIASMMRHLEGALRALLPGDTERPRFKPLRDWLTNLL